MSKTKRKLKILMLLPIMTDPFAHPVYHSTFKDMFAEHFPDMGHEVIWITDQRDKPNKGKIVNWEGIRCHIMAAPFRNEGVLCKFANAFFIYFDKISTLKKITKNEHIDIIQVRNGIIDGLLAHHFKKRNKSIVVFQLSFPLAEWMILYPNFKPGKFPIITYFRGKINKFMINWLLFKADMVLPISKWMKMKLEKERISGHKMHPLPLGCNPNQRGNGQVIRAKYDLDGYQTLIYIGNMDMTRNLELLIEMFAIVENKTKKIKMLLVGDGTDKINLERLAKKRGYYGKIIFTGFVSRNQIWDYITASDICLSPVAPLPIYTISSPTKIFEYMIMGKPIVANEEIPEHREVIEESGGGVLVKFEKESFANGINKLLDNPTKAREIGTKGQAWVKENRSYKNMARELEKWYMNHLESDDRG